MAPFVSSKSETKQVRGADFVCGAFASCFSKTCVAPISRVTTLMQVQQMSKYATAVDPWRGCGAWGLVRRIIQREGYQALWRGNGVALTQRAVCSGVAFQTSSLCSDFLKKTVGGSPTNFGTNVLTSTLGAGCGVFCSHPLDVVKTRLLVDHGREGARYYSSGVQAVGVIIREEGFRSFFRGLPASLASQAPAIAISYGLFNYLQPYYHDIGAVGPEASPQAWKLPFAGGVSGAFASFVTFPLDSWKKRSQVRGIRTSRSLLSGSVLPSLSVTLYGSGGVNSPYRRPGTKCFSTEIPASFRPGLFCEVRGLYRGIVVELVKVVPGTAIMFTLNDILLRNFR